jgi:peptide/nickel transport system permease protein
VLIGVVSGIGSSTRWYRTIFLEEISKDYVRTARAKGCRKPCAFSAMCCAMR